MVYVDSMGHMRADSEAELHAFARRLALKREWFQGHNPRYPHYDLTTTRMITKACDLGATLVSPKQIVRLGYTLTEAAAPDPGSDEQQGG